MIRAMVSGANGAMGQMIAECIAETEDMAVIAGVDKFPDTRRNPYPVFSNIFDCTLSADVLIDFSRPEALHANLSYARRNRLPVVLGTTGFSPDELSEIRAASREIAVFKSANMALGVNLQVDLIHKAAEFLGQSFDVEILERHHNRKVDAPSGTALMLADSINAATAGDMEYVYDRHSRNMPRGKKEIGMSSMRGGTIAGEHEVYFLGTDEVIEINHRALSRRVFAVGALRAARFIVGQEPGMYEMRDIILAQDSMTNVYADGDQAIITIAGMSASPRSTAELFMALAKRSVVVDIISQSLPSEGKLTLTFSLPLSQLTPAIEAVDAFHYKPVIDTGVSKITVEGAGMQYQSGVAGRVFSLLADAGIAIKLVTTSETKIAMCVDKKDERRATETISRFLGAK